MRYVGTKDAPEELATQADVGTVYTDPNELLGTPEGHMWYDEDEPDTAESGFAASATKVQAGLGLAGGGDLTVDRTLMIDFAADGVSSATKAVRADDTRLSGSHNHSASQITSGTLDVARIPTLDSSKVQYVPIRLFWSGTAWPARPSGAYSVDWVGPAGGTTPPWTSVDTWTQY